jgi:murein DD-endopeptidase MepM/ murein hydrolase activator NlpD
MGLVLNQPSTDVPIRIAKRLLAGIIIVSTAAVASATVRNGLEFGYEQGVTMALSRIASLTLPARALAAEDEPKKIASTEPVPSVPYFVLPAKGIDWGILHANNGVDIANVCGTQVVAAADGIVAETGSGWNGGYGDAVKIAHENGTRTLYAHLDGIEVVIGQKLVQGERIGAIGMTGKSTGCHVHFEVHGGKNPFGK